MRALPVIEEGKQTELANASADLRNISFSYEDKPIFEDLSLQIPEKKTTVIVGFSGSGKTTLCNLTSRFWNVQQGEVLVGGTNCQGIPI